MAANNLHARRGPRRRSHSALPASSIHATKHAQIPPIRVLLQGIHAGLHRQGSEGYIYRLGLSVVLELRFALGSVRHVCSCAGEGSLE